MPPRVPPYSKPLPSQTLPNSRSDGTSFTGEEGRKMPWGAEEGMGVAKMVNMAIEDG
jgi:hypothetical protein